MSRYLRRCFRGLEQGDPATSTILLFGLQTRRLIDRGIIRLDEARNEYVFAWRSAA